MASSSIMSWQSKLQKVKAVADFILEGAPKSLWMMTVAMKLKEPCSLEEKL